MFSAGHANACLSVAKILKQMNAEVIFLHKQEGSVWWDDVHSLREESPKTVLLDDFVKSGEILDLVVEITFLLTPQQRKTMTKRSVWYNRKPSLFSDIESIVYINRPDGRNLEGISSIWVADIFTHNDDVIYLETLYPRIPIVTVPWIWTPDIVEHHRATTKSPVWSQAYEVISKNEPWSIHVAETNNSSCSSCTLPMVIIRQAFLKQKPNLSRITFHNMDILKEVKFFKENVLKHASLPDISYNLIGRQRIIDWVHDPHSVILSHSRFIPLKAANLEAAWVGIPLVHNSTVLQGLGNGLEKTYYSSNDVSHAASILNSIISDVGTLPYSSSLQGLTELRKAIVNRFYPLAKIQEWSSAILGVMKHSPAAVAAPKIVASVPVIPSNSDMPVFNVLFTDMWEQFNESYNMFTLALDNALKSQSTKVIGHSRQTIGSTVPNIVVFGPFGEDWKSLPSAWPKVHFTGENTGPINDPSVKLNIGYKLPEISDDSYLRMPLWMFEIDWFGADSTKILNPIPLPIDTCTKVVDDYDIRNKFCAFVVTNPKNHVRNDAFKTLNKYKPVDSAGRLFNNVGNLIFAGEGGGGGELKKHVFLKDYRFCITYENAATPGYTTEKILHAKAAGCVPIYWGDSKVSRDFNEKGFLNANGCRSEEDLIRLVDEVETNPEKWRELASVPALSTYSRDLVRRTFSEMVRRFLVISGNEPISSKIPPFLGAKTTDEAISLRAQREPARLPSTTALQVQPMIALSQDMPLCVTCATQRFWPSLLMWLNAMKVHNMPARVYVGSDVSDSSLALTKDKYKEVEFIRFPTETPSGFPDFWDAKHFAWKIWIFNQIVNDERFKGRTIYYTDSGSVTLRWPTEWMKKVRASGLTFLEDSTQINRHWCNETFCDIMKVTEEEKAAHQIWAGGCMFVAGHPLPMKVFTTSYKMAQEPDIIVGDKWTGIGPDGKPFGHRHDQSILSIVGLREKVPTFPLEKVYGHESARTTFHSGQCIYVHRGNFKSHIPFLKLDGIDDGFFINLDRRDDRKKNFLDCHSYFRGNVRRLPAYDGRKLELTPYLARLFKPNDFLWKKAVMGCALSHMKIWNLLMSEPPEIQSYLIMEDDARLVPGWQDAWRTAYASLPEGWDCVYLGGILPPNREAFVNSLERVGPCLAKVVPNRIFGQREPTTYFHFCAYAYVLSRSGAKKILDSIMERDGYWTSADHMICNRVDHMNLYVLDPLVAGASQDDDPAYKSAEFNNFNRIDSFDSDLWNNDERFLAEEIQAESEKLYDLHINKTIAEVDAQVQKTLVPKVPKVPEVPEVPLPKRTGTRFISLDICNLSSSTLYESKWLQDLFQTDFLIERVSIDADLKDYDNIVLLLIKPKWTEQRVWLNTLRAAGYKFKIIHLSDEFGSDPIDFYSWPEVTGVMRFYSRDDLPVDPKIIVVPLGYHWQFKGNRDVPHLSTPELPFREQIWSFAGTDWKGRSSSMEILNVIKPHYVKWFSDWNDPGQLQSDEYICLMLNSKFVPCPPGQNVETFRFYEALECGCIPILIGSKDLDTWMEIMFTKKFPFIIVEGWQYVPGILTELMKNPEQMNQYRMSLLMWWASYKMELKERVRVWFKG